jgi:hypothetical protein
MGKRTLLAVAMLAVALTRADAKSASGTIVSESSVDCGSKKEGHKGKTELDLVCQEYVVRAADVEYHIRQPKQKDQGLLPLNSTIDFTLDKDQMKFKLNGKKYQFLVVSEASVDSKQP